VPLSNFRQPLEKAEIRERNQASLFATLGIRLAKVPLGRVQNWIAVNPESLRIQGFFVDHPNGHER
jgi:hypothetical protein